MRLRAIGVLALMLIFGLSPGLTNASPQETAPPTAEPQPETEPAAEQVSARCSDCHEQAAAFAMNPHATGALDAEGVPNAVCETCHGDGTAHIEGGGDTTQ